jgi:endonuclease/exonuclease/phosphatase family metal-dependent hydrolase
MHALRSVLLLVTGLTCACSSTADPSGPANGGAGGSVAGSGGAAAAAPGAASGAGSNVGGAGNPAGASGSAGAAGSVALGGQSGAGQAGTGGQAGAAGQAGSAAALELHITSSNIRYGTADDGINAWPLRKALLFQVLKDQAFDSAGLQEALASQLTELDAALPEYGRVGVGRDDGKTKGEYSPILYLKQRYQVVSSGTFWFSDTPEVPGSMSWGNTLPRICSWARFKHVPSGRHYWHYNVHLDHLSEPSRQKSAQLVATRMAARPELDEPAILTGDFNATPDSVAVRYLLGEQPIDNAQTPITLIDAWLKLHAADPESMTFHGFEGGATGGTHIDYVMYGSGMSAQSAEIVRTHDDAVYPSDHYPVTAVLDLP